MIRYSAGKFTELRTTVEDWLAYVPQTFPHYTRHTVRHSDTIILQLSKVLFRDDDVTQPTIPLSRVEAYILAVCAMLHDSGMVVSDPGKSATNSSIGGITGVGPRRLHGKIGC